VPVLSAAYAKKAPTVDGAGEALWKAAPITKMKLKETGESVEVQALFTDTDIYVKAVYPDPTHDYIDRPWRFDGQAWSQIGQQDSLCFIWNVSDSIRDFNTKGFDVLDSGLALDQHPWDIYIDGGKADDVEPWFERQQGDFWSTGLQLPYGYAEDWVMKFDKKTWADGAWRAKVLNQHDAFVDGAAWSINKNDEWTQPRWALKPGIDLLTYPYPVLADMVDYADHAPVAGELQPFVVYNSREARWGGSKDDIPGVEKWSDGMWTVEMSRALDTGHNDDIQFDPGSGDDYYFGLLVRREGRRYEPTGPARMIFKKS
jgi:hypothetical protein